MYRRSLLVSRPGRWVWLALLAVVLSLAPLTAGCGKAKKGTTLTLAPGVTMEFVRVPPGDFTMGSTEADPDNQLDEKPQHTVYLDEYEIGKYEVTIAQFRAFVLATGYQTMLERSGGAGEVYTGRKDTYPRYWSGIVGADWEHPRGPDTEESAGETYPVTQLAWDDAAAFCEWAGQVTGRTVRLPTEAEWEKAARGTDGRKFPWGNAEPTGRLANYGDRNLNLRIPEKGDPGQDDGYACAAPVGSYPMGASPYGAMDMAGNVFELCSDNYWATYYAKSPRSNPPGSVLSMYGAGNRALRGGSFTSGREYLRCADRDCQQMSTETMGFRVVLEPAAK